LQSSSANAISESLGSEVFTVASSAIDFGLSFAHVGRIDSLVARVAEEAAFVPSSSGTAHQLRNKDRLFAPRTNLGATPFWKRLWFAAGRGAAIGRGPVCFGLAILLAHHFWGDVGLSLVIDYLVCRVIFPVVHAETAGAPAKAISFWPKVFAIA